MADRQPGRQHIPLPSEPLLLGQTTKEYEAEQATRGRGHGVKAYRELLKAHGRKPQRLIVCDLPHEPGKTWPTVAVIAENPLADVPELRIVTDVVNQPWGPGRGLGSPLLVRCDLCHRYARQQMSDEELDQAHVAGALDREIDPAKVAEWSGADKADIRMSEVRAIS